MLDVRYSKKINETPMTNKFDTYENDYQATLGVKFCSTVRSVSGIIKKRIGFGAILDNEAENHNKT